MITSQIVVAYIQCTLKAYLLLCTRKHGTSHEYVSILNKERKKNRRKYLSNIKTKILGTEPYSYEAMKKGVPVLINANLEFDNFKAFTDVLTKGEKKASLQEHPYYIPTLMANIRNSGIMLLRYP